MIRTEMGGGTISLNMGPISLGIWDLGPYITREMGPGGPISLLYSSSQYRYIANLIVVARQL